MVILNGSLSSNSLFYSSSFLSMYNSTCACIASIYVTATSTRITKAASKIQKRHAIDSANANEILEFSPKIHVANNAT